METMELQVKEMTTILSDNDEKKIKLETELKASIDKIFVLREIISELETQIESKTLNEHVYCEKVKELESYIATQSKANDTLHQELESIKSDVDIKGYTEKVANLEEQLRQRTSSEQSLVLEQMTEQLRDIGVALERKTKNLETIHADICSASCSSPSEDVSVKGESPRSPPSLPVDQVHRILDKLSKHSRAEEAAIKRIRDLEMQVNGVRISYSVCNFFILFFNHYFYQTISYG